MQKGPLVIQDDDGTRLVKGHPALWAFAFLCALNTGLHCVLQPPEKPLTKQNVNGAPLTFPQSTIKPS